MHGYEKHESKEKSDMGKPHEVMSAQTREVEEEYRGHQKHKQNEDGHRVFDPVSAESINQPLMVLRRHSQRMCGWKRYK